MLIKENRVLLRARRYGVPAPAECCIVDLDDGAVVRWASLEEIARHLGVLRPFEIIRDYRQRMTSM